MIFDQTSQLFLFYGDSKVARRENRALVGMGYCRLRGDNPSYRENKGFRSRLHSHGGITHHPRQPVRHNVEMVQREGTMKELSHV